MTAKERTEVKNKLKSVFRSYRKMNASTESRLSELGILVTRQRNHIILSVGNGRHIPIACTGSDKREGLNIATKIMKAML
ncbi:MAG: hypothetical protein II811_04990 [Spirochaetaceae bacterium]|nr:hypothetical protein [Spirochaetaceae bacterium]